MIFCKGEAQGFLLWAFRDTIIATWDQRSPGPEIEPPISDRKSVTWLHKFFTIVLFNKKPLSTISFLSKCINKSHNISILQKLCWTQSFSSGVVLFSSSLAYHTSRIYFHFRPNPRGVVVFPLGGAWWHQQWKAQFFHNKVTTSEDPRPRQRHTHQTLRSVCERIISSW